MSLEVLLKPCLHGTGEEVSPHLGASECPSRKFAVTI